MKLRGESKTFLASAPEQWAFAAGFVLLMASTFLTFSFVLLRFDNIAVLPETAERRLRAKCGCDIRAPCPGGAACLLQPMERRFARIRSTRTFDDYVETFCRITLERQGKLRVAQRATITASVLFFLLIGHGFYGVLDHLHPASWPWATRFQGGS